MEKNNIVGLEMENNVNTNDFGFIDFMDEANFEQFLELIRGENAEPAAKFCPNYDCEHISGCLEADSLQNIVVTTHDVDDHQLQLFDFNNMVNNNDVEFDPLLHDHTMKLGVEDQEIHEEGESSGTTTTADQTLMMKRTTKTDRSRTLISERKRRGRMKEKLYALRSLVPNITKMDKASIIGDAVLHIQELQMHANKLKAEIVSLEKSLTDHPNKFQSRSFQNANKFKATQNPPIIKKIIQMEVFQMEEREFYGRIVCNKGKGIAALLYKALESLTSFKVQSSNLAAPAENYVLTFTLHVEELKVPIIDFPNLKLWIASALLNLGFDFVTLSQV